MNIILWVTTQTQLFLTPPQFFFLAGEWPKLFREINYEKTRFEVVVVNDDGVPLFLANFPEGLLCPMPRRPLMVRAALLRRSCDGVAAATELRCALVRHVSTVLSTCQG